MAQEFDPCSSGPSFGRLYSIKCPSLDTWVPSFCTCFIILQFDHESLTNCWVTSTNRQDNCLSVSLKKTALIKLHDSQKWNTPFHVRLCPYKLLIKRFSPSYHTWRMEEYQVIKIYQDQDKLVFIFYCNNLTMIGLHLARLYYDVNTQT